jgi:putative CocE/NonD family hydrolase
MKVIRFLIFVFLLSFVCFIPQSISAQPSEAQKELTKYIADKYTKREIMVPMRDGVKLFTSVYEPKNKSEKYPILLLRTPYTVAPYGETTKNILGPSAAYAKEGYIFVYQDVRGRWMSEGQFEDARPDIANNTPQQIDESTDTYDTIDWMIKNIPNNNGRVGTYGISYPGFYVSAGAIDSHPALKACSPQAPIGDWFMGDDMHHNGALFLAQNWSFFRGFGQPRPTPTSKSDYLKQWKGRQTPDGYNAFLEEGGLKELADAYEKGLGIRIKFWDEMMAHPVYDQWWKDRSILPKLKNVKCATMTVGGWYDNEDLYGALNTYQHIERQNPNIPFNVLVIGPWDHGGWAGRDGDWLGTAYFEQKTGQFYRESFEIPFFNHFLKDKGDISQIKEVNLFDTGSHEWRSFDKYNPNGTTETMFYFGSEGRLSTTKPPMSKASFFDEYVSDPWNPVPYTQKITFNYPRDFMTEDQRFVANRPDVLVYQTDVLTEDITVAGDIKPELYVSSTGTDSDFVVKLIDVFPDDYNFPLTGKTLPNGQPERVKPPDNFVSSVFQPGGYQMLLRGEPMPARFRNSFEKAEPLKPNTPTKISFVMPGVTHTFKKGHRIMVQIQSTWFPLVARNPQRFVPNYKLATAKEFQKATQKVYRSNVFVSGVKLPVLK